MPHGAPDYSNVRVPGLVSRVDDMAELAVRLGSPSSIDRMGTVVLIEDFSTGITVVESLDGGKGGVVEHSTLFSHYGGYTIRLARVADTGSYTGFTSRSAARTKGRVGAEVLFSAMTGPCNIKLYFIHNDGEEAVRFGLRWDGEDNKVYIGGDTEGWEEANETFWMLINYPIVHSMKLVGDVENEEYVRAYIDGSLITLPSKDPRTWDNNQAANLGLTFYNGLDPALASTIYADVAILTQNEP